MRRLRRMRFTSQTVQLAPGLSRQAAYRAASKKAVRDFRGMTYNPRTGRAVLT